MVLNKFKIYKFRGTSRVQYNVYFYFMDNISRAEGIYSPGRA